MLNQLLFSTTRNFIYTFTFTTICLALKIFRPRIFLLIVGRFLMQIQNPSFSFHIIKNQNLYNMRARAGGGQDHHAHQRHVPGVQGEPAAWHRRAGRAQLPDHAAHHGRHWPSTSHRSRYNTDNWQDHVFGGD